MSNEGTRIELKSSTRKGRPYYNRPNGVQWSCWRRASCPTFRPNSKTDG